MQPQSFEEKNKFNKKFGENRSKVAAKIFPAKIFPAKIFPAKIFPAKNIN